MPRSPHRWRRACAAGLICAGLAGAPGIVCAQFQPDDFHACTLDTVWSFLDPAGDGALAAIVEAYTDDAHLSLSVPGGTPHEIWNGSLGAPRVRQPLTDTDFTATVKFTSTLPPNFAQQGLVVEQDQDRWLRLEFYRDAAGQLYLAAVGGPTTVFLDQPLTVAKPTPLCLSVVRAGDLWTVAWCDADLQWQALGEPFLYALAPSALGIYAGNRGLAPPAHTVDVDWIALGTDGEANDDLARNTLTVSVTGGGLVSREPDQSNYACGQEVAVTALDQPGWRFSEWTGALAGTANPAVVTMDGPLSLTAVFVPAPVCTLTTTVSPAGAGSVETDPPGAVQTVGSTVTIAAVPAPGWAFVAWEGDLSGAVSPATLLMDADRSVAAMFAAVPPPFVGDDFNRCALGAPWTVVDPLGDGSHAETIGGYLGEARLAISVPGGVPHEIWDGFVGATHVVQPAADADFTVEAKLDADLPAFFGQEGLLVLGDESSWVRAEFLRDEFGQLRAALVLGPQTVAHDLPLPPGAAPPLWLRVTRSGDVFTQLWSPDGADWHQLGAAVDYAMAVTAVGVYAGNRGLTPPAHTVLVDYFNHEPGAPALEDEARAPLTVSVVGGGSVERLLDLPTYACGQEERLTAVPLTGWTFAGWEGDAGGTTNPLWVTMDGPRAVTARFTFDLAAAPLPLVTRLYPCAPNPFNPRTTVAFELAREGSARLCVYGLDGRLIRELAAGRMAAGRHEYAWDGRDSRGRLAAAGAYLLRLSTPDGEREGRVVLLK